MFKKRYCYVVHENISTPSVWSAASPALQPAGSAWAVVTPLACNLFILLS